MARSPSSRIVLTSKPVHSSRIAEIVCRAHLRGANIIPVAVRIAEIAHSSPASAPGFLQLVSHRGLREEQGLGFYRSFKNVVEPGLALLLIVLASPLLLLIALAVRLTSDGPILYTQTRVGVDGSSFEILKFRSMKLSSELSGPRWASADPKDPRLTPIGGLLRASHFDELPQLWNIFRGDMSFIGPRPERPSFIQEISEDIPLFRLRALVKPGVTGWAQVRMGYANTIEDCRHKLEFDLYYLLKHSPWLDFMIVLLTFKVLLSGGTEAKKRELKTRIRESRPLKAARQQAQAIAE